MKAQKKGEFYGQHKRVLTSPHIVMTDTAYTLDRVDWHYHEHAYFTFLLKGTLQEFSKKGSHTLKPGNLLFHHWQDAHYNIKPPGYAQGYHVEIEQGWFEHYDVDTTLFAGSRLLEDPVTINLFAKLYCETTLGADASRLSMQGLLLQVFGEMIRPGSLQNKAAFMVGARAPVAARPLRREYFVGCAGTGGRCAPGTFVARILTLVQCYAGRICACAAYCQIAGVPGQRHCLDCRSSRIPAGLPIRATTYAVSRKGTALHLLRIVNRRRVKIIPPGYRDTIYYSIARRYFYPDKPNLKLTMRISILALWCFDRSRFFVSRLSATTLWPTTV